MFGLANTLHKSFVHAQDKLRMTSGTFLRNFYLSVHSVFLKMSRRPRSPEISPQPLKKQKLDHLTSEDYKNGVFLAPMVRSGACKHRAVACIDLSY
jgi:hypothetical protein